MKKNFMIGAIVIFCCVFSASPVSRSFSNGIQSAGYTQANEAPCLTPDVTQPHVLAVLQPFKSISIIDQNNEKFLVHDVQSIKPVVMPLSQRKTVYANMFKRAYWRSSG